MHYQRLALLNTPVITDYGTFRLEPVTLAAAQLLLKQFAGANKEIVSAVGHRSTADLLSELLDHRVEENRIHFKQTPHDLALVFKLLKRPPEGTILTREQLDEAGYEFALLTRLF